jgi:hypothetical protein
MFSNKIVVINPKLLILNYLKIHDKLEIESRQKNTYFDKIIGVGNNLKKNTEEVEKKNISLHYSS